MAGNVEQSGNVVAEQPKKKKNGLLLIIIIVLILLLLFGSFMGYAFFTKSFFFAPKEASAEVEEVEIKETMFPLEGFVVNLDAGGPKRYLKVTMAIGCLNKKDIKKLQEKQYQIRDIVIATLRSKDIDTLEAVEKADEVKEELVENINTLFVPDIEMNLYFTEFIIQ